MLAKLTQVWLFIKNHWGKILLGTIVVVAGFAFTTGRLQSPIKRVGQGQVEHQTTNKYTAIAVDPNAPPPVYPPIANAGVATNSQPQLVPGQQPSPTGTPTATAVTINGDVRIENLNLAIAVGGGTAATSTIEKKWYDMPPTRYENMLDENKTGRRVVGQYEDIVFIKPNGWYADPVIEDAREGIDFLAVKNKGTHESPDWVNAMNYRGNACELRIRSLRFPVKVRFALLPKE